MNRQLTFKEELVKQSFDDCIQRGLSPESSYDQARWTADTVALLLGPTAELSAEFWDWLKVQAGIDPKASCCPICGGVTPPINHAHCLKQLGEWPAKGTRYNDDV